jgi:hypothetical protein
MKSVSGLVRRARPSVLVHQTARELSGSTSRYGLLMVTFVVAPDELEYHSAKPNGYHTGTI